MTVGEIYKIAVDLGITNDLRGKTVVQRKLNRVQKQYDKMSARDKELFDLERLTNPYSDTRILHDNGRDVKKVMVGIDIDTAELLVAKQLGTIDLVISHHPQGLGKAGLHDVMDLQAEVLAGYGVPINIAQSVLKPRIQEVNRGVGAHNLYKTVDSAEILDVNLISTHTVTDNLVATYLRDNLEKKNFTYVSEIMNTLRGIPEYIEAEKKGFGPTLFAGSEENYAGKVAITEVTGGTEGSPAMYEKLANAGVGTIVGMHMSEKHKEAAEKNHMNAIIAGHMSSDSLGINLFLDELEKRGIIIVPCSGLIRVSRVASVI